MLIKSAPPISIKHNIKIASLQDLAGTKIVTITQRSNINDYIDIYFLLKSGISLKEMINWGKQIYGNKYNDLLSLKAICYFEDVKLLSTKIKKFLSHAVDEYYK